MMARRDGPLVPASNTVAADATVSVIPDSREDTGSAIVEFGYTDVPEEPATNTPPDADFDTHECPRREPAGQLQIVDFLASGVVNNHCDGQCIGLREGLCD